MCKAWKSSRFYALSRQDIEGCFSVKLEREREKVCASCQRRIVRWKNLKNVSTRATVDRGTSRSALKKAKKISNLLGNKDTKHQPCLYDLPVEIIVCIAKQLEIVDVISVGRASTKLRKIVSLPCVWKKLVLRDFPSLSNDICNSSDFRSLYISLHTVNGEYKDENRFLSKCNNQQASTIKHLNLKLLQHDTIGNELEDTREKLSRSEKTLQVFTKLITDRSPSSAVTKEQEQVRL